MSSITMSTPTTTTTTTATGTFCNGFNNVTPAPPLLPSSVFSESVLTNTNAAPSSSSYYTPAPSSKYCFKRGNKAVSALLLEQIVLGSHTPATLAQLIALNPMPPTQLEAPEEEEEAAAACSDDQALAYCDALHSARKQIVGKLRSQLRMMRDERRKTQMQLRKLQHIRRKRAAAAAAAATKVIDKPTMDMLKKKKNVHVGVNVHVDGPLANHLSLLQLSSSSVSSACTDAGLDAMPDQAHKTHMKKWTDGGADDHWLNSTSPLSAEDYVGVSTSMSDDTSNGNHVNDININNGNIIEN